jgi:hypothetical protein
MAPDAFYLVAHILENEDEDIDAKSYVVNAKRWHRLDLIPTQEWRDLYRNLGFRVTYVRRHLSSKYGMMTVSLKPKDGRPMEHWSDGPLVREYTYEFLEKKLGVKRDKFDFFVGADAMSGEYLASSGKKRNYNTVLIRIAPFSKDPASRENSWAYQDMYLR